MPLLTDPLFLAAAAVAVTFLGISKGGFIGLGVSAVPLLSLFVSPQQAMVILLPVLLIQDIVSVYVYHRDFSAWNLKVLIPGVTLGVVIAGLVAATLPVPYVRLAVGLIAILFIVSRMAAPWIERHLPKPGALSGLFWGAMSGFTSMLANAGSPPYQIHMLPQRLAKMTFVGTTALFFAYNNFLKLPAYAALGQLTWPNVLTGVALVPLAIATNFLGVYLVRRVSMEAFYRIAYVLIFLIAAELLRESLAEIWHG